ncbi:MAG: serine hydrolase [Actinomycetota bacterium]
MTADVRGDLEAVFEAAGTTGYVHARDVDGEAGIGLRADELVVTASVFKIAVLLELCRRTASGGLDPTERVRVTSEDRGLGPTGLSVTLDDVELSWRDLAYLMMSVSDNTATDVIMRCLGRDAIQTTLNDLGLSQTKLEGTCAELLGTFAEDVGVEPGPKTLLSEIDPEALARWRTIDPQRTTRSTPEETTRLLSLIWRDEAGDAVACAEARRIMYLQVWPHRLTAGFPDGVRLGAKTGTLPGIRNEAGVAEYPDGKRYAVAVFTRSQVFADRRPEVDAAIGKAAYLAVEALRIRG